MLSKITIVYQMNDHGKFLMGISAIKNMCEKEINLKKVSKHANQKMNGHDNLFTVVCRH